MAKKELYASYADLRGDENQDDSLTESVAASLNEQLSIISIPHLSSREQIHLANIVECVAVVEKHTRSMDENASRFLLFFRQYMLRKSQHAPNLADISWREITWALHSNSQDILVDLVSRHFHGRMGWQQVRECGMLMWLKDISAVVSRRDRIVLGWLSNVPLRENSLRSLRAISTHEQRRRTPSTAACFIWLSRRKMCS